MTRKGDEKGGEMKWKETEMASHKRSHTIASARSNASSSSCSQKKTRNGFLAAVESGQLTTIRLLLNKSGTVTNPERKAALLLAAELGFVEVCKELVKFGTEVNCRGQDGYTALHKSSQNGLVQVTTFLCQAGTELDALGSERGESPLFLASEAGHKDLVVILLKYGAQPTLPAFDKVSPLHIAAENGHVETCEVLIDHLQRLSRDPDQQKKMIQARTEKKQQTALHFASFHGQSKVCKVLLSKGFDTMDKDADQKTALHLAAHSGDVETVQAVVETRALEAKDVNGQTPLHCAAERGNERVCEFLLGQGVNCLAVSNTRATALHKAAMNGHDSVVTLLLKHGAVPSAGDQRKKTPLMMAAAQGHTATCELLLKADASSVNLRDNCHALALHWAAGSGHTDVCLLLLQHGAEIDQPDFKGQTPFLWAAQHNHMDTCRALIYHGAKDPIEVSLAFHQPLPKCKAKPMQVVQCQRVIQEEQDEDEDRSEQEQQLVTTKKERKGKRGLLCRFFPGRGILLSRSSEVTMTPTETPASHILAVVNTPQQLEQQQAPRIETIDPLQQAPKRNLLPPLPVRM